MTEYHDPAFPRHVGACIYCGATMGLGDEHVIPYGLDGTWVLRKASCRACAAVTSRFEGNVLREMLLPLRAKLGMRTRRKQERPRTLPLTARRGAERVTVHLPAAEHPGTVIFPKFPPAVALAPRPYGGGTDVVGSYTFYAERDRLARLADALGATSFSASAMYKPAAFGRLIAKIGYAFSIACVDPADVAEYPVLPLILGASDDVGRWVGGDWHSEENPVTEGTHAVTLAQRDGRLVAFVRLFAGYGAPEYHAVVGRLR